ncbi:Lipopolysaccharide kinase (Kdo/WaaP) family protein [Jatrophihabitans endophyticus]|uniref:Lipopolysaccharide kinase (Kdo/WaaP) family protein n=1 Tax=Jatrophihabitans endophyticus TaxID=1206085 RepID=A0A1M5MX63_9ACTN|nr:DUF4032 domain-containing protein [Jatrophihabitans endophyticus]SHG81509.1 Lipopolysaccharide kinase (Kdo/WaaP) family protein [Jatrophihabitans endophyticus]
MGNYRLTTLGTNTALLDLPFELPLAQWPRERLVFVPRGISRHVVRFVELSGEVFAIKEATDRYVLREHRLLRSLAEASVPVVEAYGTVTERVDHAGEELGALLVTRHLQFSQPYRALFTGRSLPHLRTRLLDGLAALFVQLHLAGFYWGDCSLSNTLFRRDAGALAAYLVDAETGEMHETLSPGQRDSDLQIATMNIAGELFDLQAAGLMSTDVDAAETALSLRPRYDSLWEELTSDLIVPSGENFRINAQLRRLNELGFDVSELAIKTVPDGLRVRFGTHVVEAGHHQRRLFELTGLRVQENQARALLGDLSRFRAKWESGTNQTIPEDLAARRWLDEKFYGTVGLVPPQLRVKLPDAELFHEISEHRWLLSEKNGQDVGRAAAVASYVGTVLADLPDTRVDLSQGPPTEEFAPIFD